MGDAFGRAVLDTLHEKRERPVEYRRDSAREDAVVDRYFAPPRRGRTANTSC